jgi:hypothetical protein
MFIINVGISLRRLPGVMAQNVNLHAVKTTDLIQDVPRGNINNL